MHARTHVRTGPCAHTHVRTQMHRRTHTNANCRYIATSRTCQCLLYTLRWRFHRRLYSTHAHKHTHTCMHAHAHKTSTYLKNMDTSESHISSSIHKNGLKLSVCSTVCYLKHFYRLTLFHVCSEATPPPPPSIRCNGKHNLSQIH